jgi:L-asparagine transporter-like permease
MATPPPQSKGTLVKALRIRHLIFLAVGGTIASGFYLASGGAISLAGPAVLITYVFAGLVTIGVMACWPSSQSRATVRPGSPRT